VNTACILLSGVVALAGPDDAAWRHAGEHDGILVEQRAVAGSSLLEVRATGRSPLPPEAVLATVWDHRAYVQFVPYLKHLDVLAEGADWLVVYEQVAMPVVTDRDYTIRLTRGVTTAGGGFTVAFHSVPGEGPPESDAYVRVREIEGMWLIEPDAGGGCRAAYSVRSDPGGILPAWIVNRLQVQVTARFVAAMLARAQTCAR
jgi:ribosome-associated toxin RatA of RatAB toxin-antitoxin module